MDKYAQRSQELAVASQEDGFFDREIVPVNDQEGNEVAKDDGPRASVDPGEALRAPRGVRGRRRRHRRQLLPAQRRRRGGAGDVRRRAAKELGLKPPARRSSRAATRGNEPEYMGVAPIGAIKKVLERAGMTIDDVDVVELNEAFAAQVIPIMDRVRHPAREAEHARRRDRPRPPVRDDRRPDHGHAAERDGDRRPPGRPRDDVRRRRPGRGDDRRAPELSGSHPGRKGAARPRTRSPR